MEDNIQNMKKNMKIDKIDILMALIWLPFFALGYYIIAMYVIQIIWLILYSTKSSLTVLAIKLLAIISVAFVIFVSILIAVLSILITVYYYKIAHNKLR